VGRVFAAVVTAVPLLTFGEGLEVDIDTEAVDDITELCGTAGEVSVGLAVDTCEETEVRTVADVDVGRGV